MKIALCQINYVVGAIEENCMNAVENIKKAKKKGADIVVFPEMALTGYPPKDLLLKKGFVRKNIEMLDRIKEASAGIYVIIGCVDSSGGKLFNSAKVISEGKVIHSYNKIELPNYDIFDEKRYFTPGGEASVFSVKGIKVGVNICEDIWFETVIKAQAEAGAGLIINISASPFYAGKHLVRQEMLSERARKNKVKLLYLNHVGAQDDLIFEGRSYIIDSHGDIIHMMKAFSEDFFVLKGFSPKSVIEDINPVKDIRDALVLGVRDYFRKNGFKKAIVGLSGGIDSALTCAIAVEALGKENVKGISMPSRFSSKGSLDDAEQLARNLGIAYAVVPINTVYEGYLSTLKEEFRGTPFGLAEENIQARIRGNILMAISNKHGYLVLSTGNKSELSVGYATLYGDMAGGLAVISDLLKTKVYEVSRYINEEAGRDIIPPSTIQKEPSAELRENQKDSDSLPEYSILDPIVERYVERVLDAEDIVNDGFDRELVGKVISMIDRNEYKRMQAVLGLRITPIAFGFGRRMPITNRWSN